MKLDEILTLGKMGYTKEEIQAFEKSSAGSEAPETKPEPKEDTNTGTNTPENNVGVDTILSAIQELTKTIQASNIQNASSATVNNSADDVIKSIIRGGEQ